MDKGKQEGPQWPQLAITCRYLPVPFRVPPKIKFPIPGVSTEVRIDVGSSDSKHAALPCRIVRPKETCVKDLADSGKSDGAKETACCLNKRKRKKKRMTGGRGEGAI